MATRRALFQRGQTMQPVRTMPEQDETGRGQSGPTSNVPLGRQRLAALQQAQPDLGPEDDDLVAHLLRLFRVER